MTPHRHLPAPPGAPTLLALQGRGGREDDLLGLVDALGGRVGLLAPRGPEEQPPGYAWFLNRGIGIPVPESFEARLGELAAWLAAGGDDDPFLPLATATAGVASYRAAGAEVTEILRPGGHGVGPEEIGALQKWLDGTVTR